VAIPLAVAPARRLGYPSRASCGDRPGGAHLC